MEKKGKQNPRRSAKSASKKALMTHILQLRYQPPHDFDALLAFFAKRAIPGVEQVDADSYRRVFAIDGRIGALRVRGIPDADALQLEVDADKGLLPEVEARIRRMFDLDADIATINAHLGARRHLKRSVARHPGQRLPGGWDGFEIAIRAVLGQQVTVAAARTLTERVVRKFGEVVRLPGGGEAQLFPTPLTLAEADLGGLGITGARMRTLQTIARRVAEGAIDFDARQSLDDFVAKWTAVPGIGAWTAHYLAMRGLAQADAFPAADIVLRKAVARAGEPPLATSALEALAERWRPYRAYAVLHLWRSTM
jgi:AraC family transcriptional regulator of adaptative response / DNA-3-methyladenine glycosylase II